ncbi:serine hydrolase [Mycobacterium noviomagense]|uniref:Putative lipoprotein LppW n=1 Tax=Mycobacterium noviomagense TaxID=459858 RepID=A0A7I7PH50_9MYCO|nr:hypothetical protein [Mycobacterium noviomagense]ORB10825.1 hypothetical protein BST37_22155 [Mycobacterium noviomagense]BBY07881.1 putative lipoprotein LppW [Mycobacterium noviomagense]
MRPRPPMLRIATVVMLIALLAGCEAKVYGASAAKPPARRSTPVAPLVQAIAPLPLAHAGPLGGLQARIQQASDQAAADGATLSVAVLDRATNQLIASGNTEVIATASVAKLFIADELLLQEAQGRTTLSADDRRSLDAMLQSSDDDAAERFWSQAGAEQIITQVASRYGLASTQPPSDGRWWNTISSTPDLVRYYRMLLDGAGGLPPERAKVIIDDLARSTPTGVDGYPQRFGIPDGLYAEPVAVKQGWMCCIGEDWTHLSTGVVGPDSRYVMVVESLQPSDDATARDTITKAVKTMFPTGRI